jgi:hypothetical protein
MCQEKTFPTHSLDHLVGATEQRQRHGEAERFRGLEIDDQLDFRGLLDRQIGRLLALEKLTSVDTDQTIRIRKTGSVGCGACACAVDLLVLVPMITQQGGKLTRAHPPTW